MSENICQLDNFSIDYVEQMNILKGSFLYCKSSDQYCQAIRTFKEAFERLKPRYTLWDNRSFGYHISRDEQLWTDSFLNAPAMKMGVINKVGIIVGPETAGLQSIASLFEAGEAEVHPVFFLNEQKAISWLLSKKERTDIISEPHVKIDRTTDDTVTFSLEVPIENLSYYLERMSNIIMNHDSLRKRYLLFQSLTNQEKKITAYILNGLYNKEIASRLYISIETVKTHRKHILSKLRCENLIDLSAYKIFL